MRIVDVSEAPEPKKKQKRSSLMLSILFSLACTPSYVDRDDVTKAVAEAS